MDVRDVLVEIAERGIALRRRRARRPHPESLVVMRLEDFSKYLRKEENAA